MTEIINFPAHKIVREVPVNNELLEQAKEKGLTNFADAIADSMVDNIMFDLSNAGVDIEDDLFIRDMSLTVDSLRATIYRAFGITHHLHEFIDKSIKLLPRDVIKEKETEETEEAAVDSSE